MLSRSLKIHQNGYSPFMANPAPRIAAGLALIAGGFVFGVVVGQRRTNDEPRTRSVSDPASSTSPSARTGDSRPIAAGSTPGATAEAEKGALQERVRVLEMELQTLREGAGKKTPTALGPDEAERIFEDFLKIETGGIPDPEEFRSILERLSRLDASSAQTFINRFRNAPASKSEEKKAALQLTLWAGGATAAEFVHVLLKDSTLDASLRGELLEELGQTGGGLFSVKRLPVDEALGSTAMTLARSEKVDERRAGAGLLGGISSPGSRLELLRVLAEDPDTSVKVVAMRSLSYVGDPATRKVLEPYAAQTKDGALQKAAAAAIAELDKGPR
jgi:hypothetical protein